MHQVSLLTIVGVGTDLWVLVWQLYTKVNQVTLLSIAPPGVGDGERQEREEVLGGCQDKAVPVEHRSLHK